MPNDIDDYLRNARVYREVERYERLEAALLGALGECRRLQQEAR